MAGDGGKKDNDKDLEAEARERIEEMPAETALGNRDPEGGGKGDPKEYDAEHGGRG